jgi:hypothetical protein
MSSYPCKMNRLSFARKGERLFAATTKGNVLSWDLEHLAQIEALSDQVENPGDRWDRFPRTPPELRRMAQWLEVRGRSDWAETVLRRLKDGAAVDPGFEGALHLWGAGRPEEALDRLGAAGTPARRGPRRRPGTPAPLPPWRSGCWPVLSPTT